MSFDFNFSSKKELFPGIWLYKDVIKPEMNLINRMEKTISDSNGLYNWKEATVGYREKIPEYRDCVDFKLKYYDYLGKDQYQKQFDEVWKDIYEAKKVALDDYSKFYNIDLNYWEAMNFIKYNPGQHFSYHADHGWSYISVVSMVAYINDDYEGGGLRFDKINLEVKPDAGDLYIFPSTYLFSHAALPVISGTKYSIVTMTDYNDATHNADFYRQFKSEKSLPEGQQTPYN